MRMFKNYLIPGFAFWIILISAASLVAAEEKPQVAILNQKIESPGGVVLLEKVAIYPDDKSLYGPGQENYGMPVKEEYGKGPIVVLQIEKYPDYPREALIGLNWIGIELFSDGKKLSQQSRGGIGSDRMVFGFTFWAEVDPNVSPEGAVALETLGQLELKITLFNVIKVFDIPLDNLARGKTPVFEDENFQVWEAVWEEEWNPYQKRKFTTLRIDLQNKTESASYDLTFQNKDLSKYIGPGRSDNQFYTSRPKTELTGAQLWEIVPSEEKKIFPLQFKPQ